jgi:hypothetical protein
VLDYPYNNKTATNGTYSGYYYCKYDSDVSSSYAVTAFVFLAIAQVLLFRRRAQAWQQKIVRHRLLRSSLVFHHLNHPISPISSTRMQSFITLGF